MAPTPDLTVPLLMHGLLTPELTETIRASGTSAPFGDIAADHHLGPRARWLFSAVLGSLNLDRTDEIAILTTTGDVYVSICVSVPAFNHCRISRVVTDTTKVVVIVHEFGYAFPDIVSRVTEWRARGIIVIEDCAHVIGMRVGGQPIGSFGDYSFFSLSKILPTPVGGLLRTRLPIMLPKMSLEESEATKAGQAIMDTFLPHHDYFSSGRQERHRAVTAAAGASNIILPSQPAIPFLTYVKIYNEALTAKLRERIHLAATLRDDVWLIPTNPLVPMTTYKDVMEAFT